MNKNTLLVLAIIIIPIVIMGSLAVAGAGNYPQEETSEGENHNDNTTEGAEIIAPVDMVQLPQLMVDAVDLERMAP